MSKKFPSEVDLQKIDEIVSDAGGYVDRENDDSVDIIFDFFGYSAVVSVAYGKSFDEFAHNCELLAQNFRKDPYTFDDVEDFENDSDSKDFSEAVADALDCVSGNVSSMITNGTVA